MNRRESTLNTLPVQRDHEQNIVLEPLLTIDAMMKMLGVTRPTIYALMEREGLPYIKIGKSLRFSPPSVRTWLIEHEQTCEE